MGSSKERKSAMTNSLSKMEMAVRFSVNCKKDGSVELRTQELSADVKKLSQPSD